MPLLHDAETRANFERRIKTLRRDSRGRWGKMSVAQMLWHLNKAFDLSLGRVALGPFGPPLPQGILKFIVLKLPWVKGAPTHPDMVAKEHCDFDTEQQRLLNLVGELTSKPIDSHWATHPAFGPMTGKDVSRLMAKHLDHHLRQFGADA